MHRIRLPFILALSFWISQSITVLGQLDRHRMTFRFERPENEFRACSFSPDGSLLVVGGDAIRVYHWESRRLIQKFRPTLQPRRKDADTASIPIELLDIYLGSIGGFPKFTDHIAFSPTRKDLFASSDADGCIRIWDFSNDKPRTEFRSPGSHVRQLSFSPNGMYLVSLGDRLNKRGHVIGEIRIWNTESGALEYSDLFYEENASACGFSADGQQLALSRVSNNATKKSRVDIYRVGDWKLVRTIELLKGGGHSVLFASSDSRLIVTGGECVPLGDGCMPTGRIWMVDQEATTPVAPLKDVTGGYFHFAELSSDCRQFFVNTTMPQGNKLVYQLQLRDALTGTLNLSVDCDPHGLQGLAIHPSQKFAVMCDAAAVYLLPLENRATARRLILEF